MKLEGREAICERLRRAARYIRRPTCGARHALTEAGMTLYASVKGESAAELSSGVHEVIAELTAAGSVGETVEDLSDEQVEALSGQIVELYEATCD